MRLLIIPLLMIMLTWSVMASAAPKAELWERWSAHDPASTAIVDHTSWDDWLSRYVIEGSDGINRVDYGGVSEPDRAMLDAYVGQLEAANVSGLTRAEQKAYWINFYNAGTVQVILDHWPTKSIRDIDISPGFFADGPWGKKLFSVEGEALSLDDVEHRILRPIWQDPRIHYGVNCASIGCPNLATKAFTKDNTDTLLDEGAWAYVNHPRGASIAGGKLNVSSIYEWFKDDFGGNDEGVIAHLIEYAEPVMKAELADITRISNDEYDWTINAPEN